MAAAVCDYGPSPPKSQELVNVSPRKALRASLVSHKVACNRKEGKEEANHGGKSKSQSIKVLTKVSLKCERLGKLGQN